MDCSILQNQRLLRHQQQKVPHPETQTCYRHFNNYKSDSPQKSETRDRNTRWVSHFIAIFLFWNPMVFLSVFSLSDPPPLCQKTGRSRGLKSTQESLLVWEFSSSEINATEIHEWILSTPVIRNVLGYSIMIAFRTRAHLVADLGAIFTSGINSLNITQNVWNDDDSLDQKHQQ